MTANNTINGRTPEEIKRGLEHCPLCNKSCPYHKEKDCYEKLHYDAIVLFQQLERERDAAVEALRKCNRCSDCAHYYEPLALKIDTCGKCFCGNNWQWRCVQEVEE